MPITDKSSILEIHRNMIPSMIATKKKHDHLRSCWQPRVQNKTTLCKWQVFPPLFFPFRGREGHLQYKVRNGWSPSYQKLYGYAKLGSLAWKKKVWRFWKRANNKPIKVISTMNLRASYLCSPFLQAFSPPQIDIEINETQHKRVGGNLEIGLVRKKRQASFCWTVRLD